MKYCVIFVVLFFCMTLGGCKNRGNFSDVITVDLTNHADFVNTSLNEFITDLKRTRLETNDSSLISYFSGYVGDKYIIAVNDDNVILFSSMGEFIRAITTKGKGPEEFTQIDAWTVNKDETFFLFHDIAKNYICNFNLDSQQFEENIPFEDHGYLSNMVLINDTLLSILPGMFSEYGYLFFNQTISGRVTAGFAKENTPHPGTWAGRSPIFKLSFDNSVVFQPCESDTLYRIDGNNMTPMYSFLVEKPQKNGDKTTGSSIYYLGSNESRLLFAKSEYESIITPTSSSMNISGKGYFSFDLRTEQISEIDHLSFENIDLKLDNAYISFNNKNQIVIAYQAVYFKEMIDEAIKSEDLAESEKQRLKKLYGGISENHNPIIITGKWK